MRLTISLSLVILSLYIQGEVVARTLITDEVKNLTNYGWFGDDDPEMKMKSCELVQAQGYMCEEHEVETEDGYILTLHRIPGWLRNNCIMNDKVIILQHSFLGASTNFIINSPKQSLGYLFADACFDVWIPNSRGNIYSLKHNTYTSKQKEFWKFSFDEMTKYDLPAVVDYVLKKTSQKSVYYVAHSQGGTVGFEAFTENKDLAKKIRFFGALAPVVYVDHVTSAASTYAKISADTIHMMHGRKMFMGPDWKRETFIKTTCGNSIMQNSCIKLGESLGGKFGSHFNKILKSKELRKFDYGDKVTNLAKYGSMTPPKINYKNIDVPTAVFYGSNDELADPRDIEQLLDDLPETVSKIKINDYSHLDFLYATNAEKTIFNPLIFLMKYY